MKYLLTYLFTISLIGCLGQRPVPYFTRDSTRLYYKKYVYYQKKMNGLIDKMNERQDPVFDKKIFAFEDSCKKYKELIEKYNK